jgi:hypothetical protein
MHTLDAFDFDDDLVADPFPDTTLDWLCDSELPEDETTVDVLEAMELIFNTYGLRLGDDVMQALPAAWLHRAPDVATAPDGEPIDDYDDIPGELPPMTMEVLYGHETKSAMETHCESIETRVASCILNMVTRWVEGKEAYEWTKRAVAEGEYPDKPTHAALGHSHKLHALLGIEHRFIDASLE